MRFKHHFIVLIITLGAWAQASGASPYQLNYSGRLTDTSGKPVTGTVDLKFQFFGSAGAGPQVGPTVNTNDVTLNDGTFQAPITLNSADYHAIFDGTAAVWIQVTDVTHNRVLPRQSFSAVPYALKVPVDGTSIVYNVNGELEVGTLPTAVITGDVTGDATATVVEKILGEPLTMTGLADGMVLKYVSGHWRPQTDATAGAGGEANDGSSLGGTADVYTTKSGVTLGFRGISGGNNVTVTENVNDISIAMQALDADDVTETATKKWLTDLERSKLTGIAPGADMLKTAYDTDADGKVNSAVAADTANNATQLNGQPASHYLTATNITSGLLPDAQIPGTIARDTELPTAASIATGFANDAVSGDKVHGGTLSNFASTGIDDNATATTLVVDNNNQVGINTASPTADLHVLHPVGDTANARLETNAAAGHSQLYFDRAANTTALPQIVTGGSAFGSILFRGFDGTNFETGARITANVRGTPGTDDMPGALTFSTTPDGSATELDRMTIDAEGDVGIGTTAPHSVLNVAGPIATSIRSVAANTTVAASDSIITVDASGGARTMTLPTAVNIAGRQYTIKKTDSSANAVTIDASGTQTIDGALTISLANQWDHAAVVSDGANWIVASKSATAGGSGSTLGGVTTFATPGATSFVVPTGITKVYAEAWGGGGGGSCDAGGGTDGGLSSFGTHITANGGTKGTTNGSLYGVKGNGGNATGGDVNLTGGNGGAAPGGVGTGGGGANGGAGGAYGYSSTYNIHGQAGAAPGGGGGGSFYGGDSHGAGGGGGGYAAKWITGLTPGASIPVTVGAGGNATNSNCGAGGQGMVRVTW